MEAVAALGALPDRTTDIPVRAGYGSRRTTEPRAGTAVRGSDRLCGLRRFGDGRPRMWVEAKEHEG
jgi:hypothetical protein